MPLNQSLRCTVESLLKHAIQSKSEAARLYGFTNLGQLVDQEGFPRYQLFGTVWLTLLQIMGQPESPSLIGPGGIPPTNLDPRDLAVALSLLEGEIYQTLRPLDYVLHLTKNRSENIKKFYEMNDKIRLWIIDTTLQYDEVRRRADVMTYFIKTALVSPRTGLHLCNALKTLFQECIEMRNISSATAIISALYSAAIQRLMLTTKSLTRDKRGRLRGLYQIINPDSDYRGYWDTLESARTAKGGTCIPWLKVHLIELQKALSEHPVTIQENGQHLINLKRYVAFTDRSTELLHYTPPSGDHNKREELEFLMAQFRTFTYPHGTDDRLLARSAILHNQEVLNHRSRKEEMLLLGFQY